MKKMDVIWVFALALMLVIVGCSKQQPYTGYAPYNPQSPPPIGGGCGVSAPADITEPLDSKVVNIAL